MRTDSHGFQPPHQVRVCGFGGHHQVRLQRHDLLGAAMGFAATDGCKLFRLELIFNARDFGRLRHLINYINQPDNWQD